MRPGPMAPTRPYLSHIDTQAMWTGYHFYTSGAGQVLVGNNVGYGTDFTLFRLDAGELRCEHEICLEG